MSIAQELINSPIYSVIDNYYNNGGILNRFNNFVSLRAPNATDKYENIYENMYNIIYRFTSKEEPLTDILGVFLYSCFEESIFGEVAARVLAKKIADMCNYN